MTKFPLFIKTAQNIKHPPIPPIMPLATYEEAVGYERIKVGYKQALRGQRKYTREAVKYDLFREKNNVDLWRELKSSKYTPGPYHFTVITEPKRRDLSIPKLRDKVVQLVIHEELQNMFRPVFINGSFACQYGRGPIRAAFKVQHDMRVARMKWGDDVAVIKIDARKFFYSIDRDLLKKILAKRFKKLKKKHPDMYGDLLRFYRLLCKVIDSSPEGERGIPLGNVSSQDFANIYSTSSINFASASSARSSTPGTWTTLSLLHRARRSPGSGWRRSRSSSARGYTLTPTKRQRFSICGRA